MHKATLTLGAVAALFCCNLFAEEWTDFSPRDAATGGAGAIFGRGATGAYYNPANVSRRPWEKGSFPKFELDFPVGAMASVHGITFQRVFDAIKLGQDLFDEFEDGVFAPGNPDVNTGDIAGAFKIFDLLDGIYSFNGDGVYMGTSFGAAFRMSDLFLPRDGIGVRVGSFGLAGVTSLVDLQSLRGFRFLDESLGQFDSIIQQAATNSGGVPPPSSPGGTQFSSALQGAGYPVAIADTLASIAEDSGVNFDGAAGEVLFDFLVNSRNGTGNSLESGANPLEGNRTGFLLRGAVIYELGLTYGFGLPVAGLQDWLAIGVTPKFLQCYTFSQALYIEDFQDNEGPQRAVDSLTEQLTDAVMLKGDNAQFNFGLDLGVVITPRVPIIDGMAISLSARNVNAPEFEFDSNIPGAPRKLRLDPQFRGGISYTFFGATLPLTIGVESDLNPSRSYLLPNYHTQFIRAGISFEPDFGLFGFGVRLGALKNLADADQPVTMGAGLGFLIAVVRLDIGGQYSFASTLFGGENTEAKDEGVELPQRASFFAQLAIAFSF